MAPRVQHLQPHDPVPERGPYVLLMRRFGEDDPRTVVTELIVEDGPPPPLLTVPAAADGTPADWQDALGQALALARRHGMDAVYAVDRTQGQRERTVLRNDGDRSVGVAALEDEDVGQGSDMRDRPANAGYNLTPER